jgi:hypothetical protein
MSNDDQSYSVPESHGDGDNAVMSADVKEWLDAHKIELEPAAGRRFAKIWRELADRYDDEQVREIALLTAAKYLTGAVDPADVGKTLAKARLKAEEQLAAARVIATLAVADGRPEATTASEVGVDRMALRRWLGKR